MKLFLCLLLSSTLAASQIAERSYRVVPVSSSNNRLYEPLPIAPELDPNRIGIEDNTIENEPSLSIVDSILGKGTQSRILESIYKWVSGKVKANPGCVERFVCETYRTGETMEGLPYILMKITNNAVAYTISETFDESINVKEISRAARFGRTIGSCANMKCDMMDGQLRTLGDFLGSVEDFLNAIVSSVTNAIG